MSPLPGLPFLLRFFSTFTLFFLFLVNLTESRLSYSYYSQTCPQFTEIMQRTITDKQITSPTTAAATLRLFFHDCFVTGCDASILISSTPFNKAERDSDINRSLPGDGFDVVVRAKAALELTCPGVVSCADILAVAARDLVRMVGGPYYPILLGRKDGKISKSTYVDSSIPKPTMPMSQMIELFMKHGFSTSEVVALSGAHTIGFSHCKEFSSGIYNYSKSTAPGGGGKMGFDPAYNPRFAQALQNACANYKKDPTLSVFNDIMTPNNFDNAYFQNLQKGWGVLGSDHGLIKDPRTKEFVDLYAKDEKRFFQDFAGAMQKLGKLGIKVGRYGEIRRRCDAFN